MKIGMCVPNYGAAASKKSLDVFANIAEEFEYESIWTTDHLLIPREFSSPYGKVIESLTSLAYLAAKTQKVKLGTSIIILPMREIVLFTRQAVAIQILSEDRLTLGLGAGWNEQEFKNLRADFQNRGQYYDEGIQLFRWLSRGNSEFKGDFYTIEDAAFEPIPSKEIPIIIGGNAGPSLRRAAKLGDGWFPVGLSTAQIADGRARLASLTQRKLEITLRISVEQSRQKGVTSLSSKGARGDVQSRLGGTSEEIISQIKQYEKAGADRLVCYFGDFDIETLQDRATKFGKEILNST